METLTASNPAPEKLDKSSFLLSPSRSATPSTSQQTQPDKVNPKMIPQDIPLALVPLLNLDQVFMKVFIKEDEEFMEIKDAQGKDLYKTIEDTEFCYRNLCGKLTIHLNSLNEGSIILKLGVDCFHPICCPCLLNTMEVTTETGRSLGKVKQEWSIGDPKYILLNAQNKEILRIKGTATNCCFTQKKFSNEEFKILTFDGKKEIGMICKRLSTRESFTEADKCAIVFPIDLHVEAKGLLIAVGTFIKIMFFEDATADGCFSCN